MSHPEAWHAFRASGIGGSDANVILGGEPDRVHHLWQVKAGKAQPDDLSRVLPVQMGTFTEPFNIRWFEQECRKDVTRNGDQMRSNEHHWMICTLDGVVYDNGVPAVFEAKHVSAFYKDEDVLKKYQPQLQHNMVVTGYDRAYLSVFFGNHRWSLMCVEADPIYQALLIDVERQFWDSVQRDVPPPAAHIETPVEAIRKVDMTGHNEWASHAYTWVANRGYAKSFNDAASELKKLVEPDVVEAYGAGIVIKRSKNNSLTITEAKA